MFIPSKLFIFLLAVLFSFSSLAQVSSDYRKDPQKLKDSLLKQLKLDIDDSSKIEAYAQLIGLHLVKNATEAEPLVADALKFARSTGNGQFIFRIYVQQLTLWHKTGRDQMVLDSISVIKPYLNAVAHRKSLYAYYTSFGNANLRLGRFDDASKSYQQLISRASRNNDHDIELLGMMNFSIVLLRQNRYQEMKEVLYKVIEIAKIHRLKNEEMMAKLNLGVVEGDLNNFGKSAAYYQEVIPYLIEVGNDMALVTCYANIGRVYTSMKKYPEALSYTIKAITLRQKMKDIRGEAVARMELARLYLSTDSLKAALQNALQAEKKFDSLKYFIELNDVLLLKSDIL